MWFKNCSIYDLKSFELDSDALAEKLEDKRFRPVGRQESEVLGWVSPLNRQLESLVHTANGCHLLCLRKEQKVIPASMLREAIEDKVATIQDVEGRKVYGKERGAIKDDLLSVLKPKALTKSVHTFGYLDPRHELLVVNAASKNTADAFIQLLIDSLGSLGATALCGEQHPATIMNQWLLDDMPAAWSLAGNYQLIDPQDNRQASFKNDDTTSDFIAELIEDGFWIKKLGIDYQGLFSAMIQDDLTISSIRFHDELIAENDDVDESEQYARFDADFVLMTQTLAGFIAEMKTIFKVNSDKV